MGGCHRPPSLLTGHKSLVSGSEAGPSMARLPLIAGRARLGGAASHQPCGAELTGVSLRCPWVARGHPAAGDRTTATYLYRYRRGTLQPPAEATEGAMFDPWLDMSGCASLFVQRMG